MYLLTSSMSVCSKTNTYIRTILYKKCRFRLNTVLTNLKPKLSPFLKYKQDINQCIIRDIHTSRNLHANISFNLTDIGEGIREVVVKEWFVKVGDKVSQFDNICEVQSDKASVTITSRYDGIITKLHHDVDATALVGQPLVDIDAENTEVASNNTAEETPTIISKGESEFQEIRFDSDKQICIPSVRRLAKQNNVNLNDIRGSGKNGRILKEDIIKYLTSKQPEKEDTKNIKSVPSTQDDKTEPIRGFKKAMIRTMTEALKIPHFVYCDEIAITKLSTIRRSLKLEAESLGVKLTFLPFIIKAASNALREFPILNATLDANCDNITYKSSHNIGVAMDTAVGLAVPVIRNVEKLSILEIAKELNRLMISGKQGNFTTEDLAGGTFSISNIGAIGGTYASPVILSPQVAIIAIGLTKVVPRFDSAMNIVPEEIINVSGSADHRIVDGATMAHFINALRKQIENPYLLLLHV